MIAAADEVIDEESAGQVWIGDGDGDGVGGGDEGFGDTFVGAAETAIPGDLGNLKMVSRVSGCLRA